MKKTGSFLSLFIIAFTAGILSIAGCGGSETSTENIAEDTLSSMQEELIVEEYYQLPLPGEFFSSLRDLGIKSKPNLLNPAENISNYTTTEQKAVNFGVYSSDLFYSSTFDLKSDILKYFDNLKRLADDLGISSVVTQNTMDRIESNLSNKDSLNAITSQVFYEASASLESNGQGATLALVIAGGLVESIYLSTNIVSSYKDGSTAIQLIADQKFPLENLYSYFDKYEDDSNINRVAEQIAPLRTVYSSLTETAKENKAAKDGRKVIGSETLIMINEADYKELSEKAKSVRSVLINSSSK